MRRIFCVVPKLYTEYSSHPLEFWYFIFYKSYRPHLKLNFYSNKKYYGKQHHILWWGLFKFWKHFFFSGWSNSSAVWGNKTRLFVKFKSSCYQWFRISVSLAHKFLLNLLFYCFCATTVTLPRLKQVLPYFIYLEFCLFFFKSHASWWWPGRFAGSPWKKKLSPCARFWVLLSLDKAFARQSRLVHLSGHLEFLFSVVESFQAYWHSFLCEWKQRYVLLTFSWMIMKQRIVGIYQTHQFFLWRMQEEMAEQTALWGILLYSILVCEVGTRLNSLSVSFQPKLG